jgi:NAD(P)-dependent dehydrogenase (short-subunit alcohol dehydrogenase family)
MAGKKVALITGANKGIGFEIARGLGQCGFAVLVGARDRARGETAAAELRSIGIDARVLELDVTSEASVTGAAAEIEATEGRLDVLVNNAGISAERGAPPSQAPLAAIRAVYATNVLGPIAVTQAMLPLLRKSEDGRIVNVSSTLGSLTRTSDTSRPSSNFVLLGYSSSKTALNAVTVQFARELRDTPIKVNAICPGYVATDLNQHRGARSPADGAAIAIRLAMLPADGPTGGFFDDAGAVPW